MTLKFKYFIARIRSQLDFPSSVLTVSGSKGMISAKLFSLAPPALIKK